MVRDPVAACIRRKRYVSLGDVQRAKRERSRASSQWLVYACVVCGGYHLEARRVRHAE